MSKEVLKQALAYIQQDGFQVGTNEIIASLRQAISDAEKQEQGEPVAITITGKLGNIYSFTGGYSLKKGDKVYTTPQPCKPLTDEMIVAGGKALAKLHADTCGLDFDDVWKYYAEDHKADAKAAIKAAHGIKD